MAEAKRDGICGGALSGGWIVGLNESMVKRLAYHVVIYNAFEYFCSVLWVIVSIKTGSKDKLFYVM